MTTSNEHNNAPAVPQGWTDADSDAARLALEIKCLLMDTKDLSVVSKWWGSANDALELHRQRLAATPSPAPAVPQGWTDADSDAARLALEIKCLLMDTKDLSVVSKWWASANEALELHRQRLAATPAPAPAQGEPFGYFRAEPFGWTDCSEDAEGAIALYEHPAKPAQEVGLTDDEIDENTVWHDPDPHDNVHCDVSATVRKCLAALRAKGGK